MESDARTELAHLARGLQGLYGTETEHHRLAVLALRTLGALAETERELASLAERRLVAAVWGSTVTNCPRPFAVYRHDDETGVSGSGLVAYGCLFPHSGRVAWAWCVSDKPNTYTWADSFADVVLIHGHDGKTQFVWLAEELPDLAERERRAEFALDRLRIVEHYAHGLPDCEAAQRIHAELAAVTEGASK